MKIFVLGEGAQTCGTTWLHHKLNVNQTVDMRFRREYHTFDPIENLKHQDDFREKYIQNVLNLHGQGRPGESISIKRSCAKHSLLLAFIDNVKNHFHHLHLESDQTKAVENITPNDVKFKSKTFQSLKDGLEKRKFNIKVFFSCQTQSNSFGHQLA